MTHFRLWIPFCYTENFSEQVYCVPLRVYVRKLSFNQFNSTFPRLPAQFCFGKHSQFPLLICHGQDNRTSRKVQCSSAKSAPQPAHLPLMTLQGKIHAAPFHFVSLHAAIKMSPLRCAKYFLYALTFLFLYYYREPPSNWARPAPIFLPHIAQCHFSLWLIFRWHWMRGV